MASINLDGSGPGSDEEARERIKVWTRLGTCLMTSAALSLASGASAQALKAGMGLKPASPGIIHVQGGEGGEGGEGGAAASPVSDDVAYLRQLGLVRGHLNVGADLYRNGATEAAGMHMKHPSDELYAALVPAFEARGVEGFADQLEELAAAVESRAPVSVERAYQAVLAHIAEAEAPAFPGEPADLNSRLQVIHNLVRTAADEYAVGVEDGRVVNAHEYQDALGFVRVAGGLLDQVGEQDRARAPEAIARTRQQLDAIAVAWPSLVPPERIDTDASLLYGAAARIEIAALAVE